MSRPNNGSLIPTIRWPVPKNNRGGVFSNLDDLRTHIQGESTGHYLIGSNAMWHGGIHITDETTPWCALSGKSPQEAIDYPVPYKGEQPVRCMVDGEVVAYRVNRDYQTLEWESGELAYSASFVLVRHKVQPGQTAASALTFYTAYIHLAPWSAYSDESGVYKVADGQHLRAYIDDSLQWVAATLPPGTHVNWNKADPAAHMTANGRQYAHVSLVEGRNDKMTLKARDMLWTVCDKGNLLPDSGPLRPAWWANLLPPAKEVMQFDKVVCPTPYPIKAGDAVGHMGYFQLPKDGGYNKRHQVHIECISTDKNLPAFLQNPERVGKDNPVYVKFPDGTPLCAKNLATRAITPDGRSTRGEAIMKVKQIRTEQDADKTEYWFLSYANGYVPKSDTSVEMLSQYDLEKRGFATAVDEPPVSFDHLDGKTPPKGLVRKIYDALFQASSKDTRITHRAVPHNYQRLLYRIDGNISPYSSQEYLSAIHNPSYRDVKDKMIVKHPSEWYFSPSDPIWQTFLQSLKQDAPEWYDYSVSYLEGMRWMNQVPEMTETLWHMHPLVFLDAIKIKSRKNVNRPQNVQEFLDMSSNSAELAAAKWGVPASVLLAQSALESGWGKHVKNNAYFGIKGKSPSGNSTSFGTTEVINGKIIHIKDTFRAYADYAESADDYGRFLNENKRYKPAFSYTTEPNQFITEIAKAGYATDPDYAPKLIHLMERYDLYEFDK
ncbi:glycoside hydrolase family 73 protein [Enterobacter cloacae complex sp. ECC445]|uniref:glycoside hydrolase family 73 protein n=1 Tax=Enterobacter cloacae complex sp. ECC445 TaxID=2913213 RepID=UPI001F33FAA4|nr:glycoside hydrolase family 73 protein [Enterobacter cloacae complex sp. ECC445]MCG0458850.1 glycoside hydrolase family 73 protein [Enterobacter cloacae complex sp. ECC445]